jgi:hypothetical protein
MAWEIEFTDEFGSWWDGLNESEQEDVLASVDLLRSIGPSLGSPHVDSVASSKHSNMKELRVQHRGEPYRVLFASTRAGRPLFCWAETKPGTLAGMRKTSLRLTVFMTVTWRS